MVNSCSILTALLVFGTVVLAVPIVPESIVGNGMSEGGTSDFVEFLQQSGFSQEAEAWRPDPANPVSQSERGSMMIFHEDPQLLKAGLVHNHQDQEMLDYVKKYPVLPPKYKQIVEQVDHMMHTGKSNSHPDKTTAAFQNILKVGSMYELIKMYIEQNGLSGTSPIKLERIRGGFERGEDLDVLARIANTPNSK
ncbi:hypothetical protein F5877DRAFT_66022 [Lentinula edodes]|nr:hypothetical protein F5877DRAFT_66022 [Lentinula edodes]